MLTVPTLSYSLFYIFIILYYDFNNGTNVFISNTDPRLDTNGDIMDAHDGRILQFDDYPGIYFYYALGFGACTDLPDNTYCSQFINQNGSLTPICGFEYNQTISLFTTRNLTSGSWINHGNILPINKRPYGIYLSPSATYNPIQKKYILYSTFLANDSFQSDVYIAAQCDTPFGPFKVINNAVNLTNPEPGDAKLFTDPIDGKGYLIYTSIATGHKIVVEQLTNNYLYSTGNKSVVFQQNGNQLETPTLFKHIENGKYYATASCTCCYCTGGSNVMVFIADNILGPYKQQQINNAFINGDQCKNGIIVKAQQTNIFLVNTISPKKYQYVWLGNRWNSSPDKTMGHGFTIWIPLQFDGLNILSMVMMDNFTLDIAI